MVMTRVMAIVICAGAVMAAAPGAVTPHDAIAAAVARTLGRDTAVSIADLETRVAGEPGLTAEPESGARLAAPSRFMLSARGVRRGIARATVHARGSLVRAARAIARDEIIAPDAVAKTIGDLPVMPIRPLLNDADVVGRAARRTIAAGETLTASVLRLPPVVRSGDEVAVTVRIGAVRVTGVGLASGSGQVGDTIHVMPPNSRRQLWPAKVTGPGAVEILE
jgi:flagella basal body P-ring formation protein FlgA